MGGCHEYFVRKGRSPDLRTGPADPGKRLFGSVGPAYGGEPRRPRALDAETIAKIRGMAVTYHMVRPMRRRCPHFPSSKSSRASVSVTTMSIRVCARAQYRRHQHARRVDRRSRRRRDGGFWISTVREFVKADRYLRSGLWQTQNYPLSVRLAARPQGRDRRHGPHRAGDRTPPRSFACAGVLSLAQSVFGRVLPALSGPDGNGEGGRHADRDRARRRLPPPR